MQVRRKRFSTKVLPAFLKGKTKKREFSLTLESNDGEVAPYGYFWDGGSKNEYSALNMETGKWRHPRMPSSPFSGEDAATITFAKNEKGVPVEVIVVGGYFCGKPSTMHVYVPHALALHFAGIEWPKDIDRLTPIDIVRDYLEEFRPDDFKKLEAFYGEPATV